MTAELTEGQREALAREYRTHAEYLATGDREQGTDYTEQETGNTEQITGIMVASSVTPAKYRGEDTRFKLGNPGGPGRPKRETVEARFSRLITEHTTDEEFIAVWNKTKEDATQGFKAARKDFLAYTLGNPLTRIGAQTDGLAGILAVIDGMG